MKGKEGEDSEERIAIKGRQGKDDKASGEKGKDSQERMARLENKGWRG